MSRSIVYGLNFLDESTTEGVEIAEFTNSYRLAPVVWQYLSDLWDVPNPRMSDGDEMWEQFDACERDPLDRTILGMTFDTAVITRKNYIRADVDISAVVNSMPGDAGNWPALARIFRAEPDFDAVGVQHTTVSENPFATWIEHDECPHCGHGQNMHAGEVFHPQWRLMDLYRAVDQLTRDGHRDIAAATGW